MAEDLRIYYNLPSSYFDCYCTRWDIDGHQIIVETFMTKTNLNNLRNNNTPGATHELHNILGSPTYVDSTWTDANTIRLLPIAGSNLELKRSPKLVYIKNLSDSPLSSDTGFLHVKIEGNISGARI